MKATIKNGVPAPIFMLFDTQEQKYTDNIYVTVGAAKNSRNIQGDWRMDSDKRKRLNEERYKIHEFWLVKTDRNI